VGGLDGKGFSVNIPWSCGGVGDNDYIFAFQHVVLPIGNDRMVILRYVLVSLLKFLMVDISQPMLYFIF
jgi:acetoin utilization deacetylase AcuC-like enzyme